MKWFIAITARASPQARQHDLVLVYRVLATHTRVTRGTERTQISARNRPRTGCGIVCGELPGWKSSHRLGISSHRGVILVGVTARIAGNQAEGAAALVGRNSRCLLGKVVQERLSLFPRKELEETQDRLQENMRVATFKVRTRQEIGADHL